MRDLSRLAAKRRLRVAGLMSGTSADGVDVAIVDVAGEASPPVNRCKVTVRAFATVPYPAALRRAIFEVSGPAGRVEELCRLNFAVGEAFAAALIRVARRSRIALDTIDLVGSHGQTVRHIPHGRRSTLQIGEPSVIAERTGITTVADFRPRDVAAGGQGAPLVPYADYALFRHPTRSRAVQNIGGIANVTFLPAGGDVSDVLAFDTGPGNMVIDYVTRRVTHGRMHCDRGGRLAAGGTVHRGLFARLLRHPFLRKRPPRTTGREEFGEKFCTEFYARARASRIPGRDILATVTAFTARSIADAYRRFLPALPDEVILCGGGVHNHTLVRMLAAELPGSDVLSMDAFGIDPDAKEAISFAILARETIRGVASNVPSATGARRPVVLGKIIPA